MAQKAGQNGPKARQKEGLAGQRPKSRAKQGAMPKAGQFGSYGGSKLTAYSPHILKHPLDRKLSKIIKNYQKLSKIIKNFQKLSRIIKNYQKLSKIINNYLSPIFV